jgi:glycosyltransferase involved in cell wall biosynthesis
MNSNSELISVVVTTYNRKCFLASTVKSILNQSYKNIELIIVDNCSNYDFYNYIGKFNDKRIKAFQNNNNGIISTNRNFGIEHSKGKYISFCDDDDIWVKNKLEQQLHYMHKYNADMVYSISKLIGDAKFFSNYYGIFPVPTFLKVSKDNMLINNTVPYSSVLLKSNVVIDLNGFDVNKDIVGYEDYELWLRIVERYSIMFIPKIHLFYRIHCKMNQITNPKSRLGYDFLKKRHGIKSNYNKFIKNRSTLLIILRSTYYKFVETLIIFRIYDMKYFIIRFFSK